MNKLELKHLAPYLPYDVKYKTELGLNDYYMLKGLETDMQYPLEPTLIGLRLSDFKKISVWSRNCKPILRPLTDLTEDLLCVSWIEHIQDKGLDSECPYDVWSILFENHFDVFGLIEKKLAVDINTI